MQTTKAVPQCAIPGTPLADAAKGLDLCVHCGFCLQACPTYVNLADENDSPRGRLVLMKRMLEGEIALTDEGAAQHIDRCLGCVGCETACPSGVPYGQLLEATRATMKEARGTPFIARVVLAVFRRHYLLHTALWGARLFRASGIPRLLAQLLPRRAAFPLAMLASTAPTRLSLRGHRAAPAASSVDPKRPNVVQLTGCVMHGIFRHVNDATTTALTHNGYAVQEVPSQRCCGALHAHAGDLEGARAMAKVNIAAFEQAGDAMIAVNSAGCAAMMKQYGHLLHDDASWAPRAEAVARRVRDISELLSVPSAPHTLPPQDAPTRLSPTRLSTKTIPLRVTHDAPCHQQHAQRITRQPLQLLASVPGIELVPLEDSDQCCGAAGIYNLIEPEVSEAVLAPKLARIEATGAQVVATGNPGCMMQIGAGLLLSGSQAQVMHPVELLAASYEAQT